MGCLVDRSVKFVSSLSELLLNSHYIYYVHIWWKLACYVLRRLKTGEVKIINKKNHFFSRVHVEDIATALFKSLVNFKNSVRSCVYLLFTGLLGW